jgi:hypothetical protein
MKDVNKIIREVNGSMTIEGMPLKREDKSRLRECLTGKVSFNKMKSEIVKKHTRKICR